MSPRRKRIIKIVAVVLTILVIVGLSVGGYFWKGKEEPQTNNQTGPYLEPQSNPISLQSVLGAQTSQAPEPPAPQTQIYKDESKHFSIEIPQSWTVTSQGQEVIVTVSEKSRFSIQMYENQN